MKDADIKRLAEGVMGWLVVVPDEKENWYERQVTRFPALQIFKAGGRCLSRHKMGFEQWKPEERIGDAWMLVEALRLKGIYLWVEPTAKGYTVWRKMDDDENCFIEAKDKTTPCEAICAACLEWLDGNE